MAEAINEAPWDSTDAERSGADDFLIESAHALDAADASRRRRVRAESGLYRATSERRLRRPQERRGGGGGALAEDEDEEERRGEVRSLVFWTIQFVF